MNEEHNLWTEKYRPTKVSDTLLPQIIKDTFSFYVVNQDQAPPNMILSGGSGIGKTTVARAMLNEIGADVRFVNASEKNTSAELQHILGFARTVSFYGSRKYIIMDEADYMTENLQAKLRHAMEEVSSNCGFIFTCNHPTKISSAIHSRCSVIDFDIPRSEEDSLKDQFFERSRMILEKEEVTFEENVVKELINVYYPDWRRCLNELQAYGFKGHIDEGILPTGISRSVDKLIKGIIEDDFDVVVEWVDKNVDTKANGFYGKFLSELTPFVKTSSKRSLARTVNLYQKDKGDLKVNVLGMIDEIMEKVDFA